MSDSPGLVDFAIGLVNSQPEEQVNIFRRIKITEVRQDKYFKFLINSFGPKLTRMKWNLHKQDEISHYMSEETYWDSLYKIKADIEINLEVNVAVTNCY